MTAHDLKRARKMSNQASACGLREGRPKGSRACDFLEVIRFLCLFRKGARNVYQIYHESRRFDIKKIYRYLRYCLEIHLLEIDHVETAGFLPPKYYRLTEKGRVLIELLPSDSPCLNRIMIRRRDLADKPYSAFKPVPT